MKTLMAVLFFTVAVSAYADKPAVPPGMGKYMMVLWPAGAPIPGDPKGTVRGRPEPGVEKLGGKVLLKDQNRRVILLPLGVSKQLRKNEAVVYLQRIWMGESREGWDESYPPPTATGKSTPGKAVQTEDDTNLQWGPKGYSYDGSGNVTQIGNDQFTYDSANRLITAQVSGATIAPKSETYSYDAFGNLTSRQVSGSNAVNIPVDGGSNRLLGVPYDAAGNVTEAEEGRRKYTFDSR